MPVPGEYNLKGIFITLWLTVGRARTERAWRVRLSPRARAGVVCDPDRCPRVSRNHRVRRASAARRAKHTRSPPPDSVRRKMLIACVAVPAVMFVIPPFRLEEADPYSTNREHPVSVLVTRRALETNRGRRSAKHARRAARAVSGPDASTPGRAAPRPPSRPRRRRGTRARGCARCSSTCPRPCRPSSRRARARRCTARRARGGTRAGARRR